jgi:hypothetical protein
MLKLASALLSLCLPLAAQSYNQAPAGAGCGPVLKATFNPLGNHKSLDLSVTNMFPSDFGTILFGVVPVAIQLPGNCTIWTNFVTGHSLRSDPLGTWSFHMSWPLDVLAQMYVQIGSFDTSGNFTVIKTSNCIHVWHL